MTLAQNEIVLIRHGQTQWSRDGRHTGRTDVALTPLGVRQAEAIGETLRGVRLDQVFASPLSRARETMERAGYVGTVDDDLAEWDYGSYEGRRTIDIRKEIPGWSVWTHPIAGGESLEDVSARADAVIARAISIDGVVAMFGHAHALRILAARWMGLPAAAGRHLPFDTAAISTLGWERETPGLRHWNVACRIQSGDPVL